MVSFEYVDRYVEERGSAGEDSPRAFAQWLANLASRPITGAGHGRSDVTAEPEAVAAAGQAQDD